MDEFIPRKRKDSSMEEGVSPTKEKKGNTR
jgi:hypothetical protein